MDAGDQLLRPSRPGITLGLGCWVLWDWGARIPSAVAQLGSWHARTVVDTRLAQGALGDLKLQLIDDGRVVVAAIVLANLVLAAAVEAAPELCAVRVALAGLHLVVAGARRADRAGDAEIALALQIARIRRAAATAHASPTASAGGCAATGDASIAAAGGAGRSRSACPFAALTRPAGGGVGADGELVRADGEVTCRDPTGPGQQNSVNRGFHETSSAGSHAGIAFMVADGWGRQRAVPGATRVWSLVGSFGPGRRSDAGSPVGRRVGQGGQGGRCGRCGRCGREGIRRIDGSGSIRPHFVPMDTILVRVDESPPLSLEPHERHVLDMVGNGATVADVCQESEIGEAETRKVLHAFLAVGVLSTKERTLEPMARKSEDCGTMIELYNEMYRHLYEHMLNEIGPIAALVLEKYLNELKKRPDSVFALVRLSSDGSLDPVRMEKNVQQIDESRRREELVEALNELLYAELLAVKRTLGASHESRLIQAFRQMREMA